MKNFDADKNKGFFSKVGGFFGGVKDKLSEKIKDAKIGEKIKETGEKAMKIAKKTGNFVVEKSKEAYVRYHLNIANSFRAEYSS